MAETGWTLDELVRRASEALAAGQVHVPDGRVTPLPDRRVVRWYATIGLVDRPRAYRGRTALYGPRHLLQVVAVKRRQAQGRSLAQIQAELTGATDATLSGVAQVPPDLLATDPSPNGGPASPRFWTRPPAPVPASPAAVDQEVSVLSASVSSLPAGVSGQEPLDQPHLLYAVPLATGVTLMLPARPGPDDLAAVRAAARPLLDLLVQRDLLGAEGA